MILVMVVILINFTDYFLIDNCVDDNSIIKVMINPNLLKYMSCSDIRVLLHRAESFVHP